MTVPVDLDRRIVTWLREGERGAPERLAGAVRTAVEQTPQSLGIRLAWFGRPSATQLRVAGGAVAAVLVVALAGLVLRNPFGPASTATPTPSVGPTTAVLPPTDRPSAIPAPPLPSVEATPEPTYPPARTFSSAGIEVEVPTGWFEAPNRYWLAIASALDQLHDPDAGVLSMILSAGRAAVPAEFLFHRPVDGSFDAGLRIREFGTAGASAAGVADDTAAGLRNVGFEAVRTRIDLSAGRVPVVEWDETYNGPPVHYVSAFLRLNGTVIRVDFATVGAPTKDQRRALAAILQSARPAGG